MRDEKGVTSEQLALQRPRAFDDLSKLYTLLLFSLLVDNGKVRLG